ncbi:MAG: TolB family protein [Thermoanaerobaculia bacterium]
MSASRLLVIPVGGGTPRALPTVGQAIAGAAWDASGRSLVFAADRYGEFGLWRAWLDGAEPTWLGVPVTEPVRPSTARRGGLVVSPTTGHVIYTHADREESDVLAVMGKEAF